VPERFGQTAGDSGEGHAQVILRVGIVRPQPNGSFEMGDGCQPLSRPKSWQSIM
jgi:hypothetical protein